MILQVNLLELLSGSDGKLPYFIKMELVGLSRVCHGNCYLKEVNDINEFEALKLGGTIERE